MKKMKRSHRLLVASFLLGITTSMLAEYYLLHDRNPLHFLLIIVMFIMVTVWLWKK